VRIDLIGGHKEGASIAVDDQQCLNCYVTPRAGGLALIGTMGTDLFSTIANDCRGAIKSNGTVYALFGTTLYSINSGGTATSLGTIMGSNRVSMATDQTNIVIVTGSAGYVYNGTALAAITDPDFPGAEKVNFVAGYFTFSSASRWFISEVNSATSYDALDYVGLSGETGILGQVEDHGEVINFHADKIKVWINTDNVDFPFEMNGAAIIERGLFAANSLTQDDNTIFFLGDDLIIYRLQGYTPVRISDEGLEFTFRRIIQAGGLTDLQNAWAWAYTDHGHKFYCLTIPNQGTYVINIATGLTHQLKHWDYATYHAHSYLFCYGRHLIFGIDGNIYEQRADAYDDNGEILERKRRATAFSIDDKLLKFKSLKLIFDTGHGLATGQGSDPVIMVKWYDDDGRVPRVERWLSIGEMGEYRKSVKTTGCGSSRRRIFELHQTDPVPFRLMDAFVEVT